MQPQFLRLSGAESMTYATSPNGATFVVQGGPLAYNVDKIYVSTLCSKAPFSSQISYYESIPFASKRYKSSGVLHEEIGYSYKVFDPIQSDTASCVDLLSVNGNQVSLNIPVSDGGKPAVRLLPLVNNKMQFRIIADTMINNQRFQEVCCQKLNPTAYFTRDGSVIAFYRKETWWFQTGFR